MTSPPKPVGTTRAVVPDFAILPSLTAFTSRTLIVNFAWIACFRSLLSNPKISIWLCYLNRLKRYPSSNLTNSENRRGDDRNINSNLSHYKTILGLVFFVHHLMRILLTWWSVRSLQKLCMWMLTHTHTSIVTTAAMYIFKWTLLILPNTQVQKIKEHRQVLEVWPLTKLGFMQRISQEKLTTKTK